MSHKFSLMQFTIPYVQVAHHKALYLDELPGAVTEKYKDTSGLSQIEVELFINTGLEWELGELRIVGYVSLFHLWEKHSKKFVSDLFGRPRTRWPAVSQRTYPQIVVAHLKTFGLEVPEAVVGALEEANTVVNCWKHGEEAVEKLRLRYPEYLGPKGEESGFHVPQKKLESLFNAAEQFWLSLQDQAPIDFFLKRST